MTGRIIHPSFDLQRDFVVFSFVERVIDGDGKSNLNTLRVIRIKGRRAVLRGHGPTITVASCQFVVDTEYNNPPYLEDQWSRADIEDFLRLPTALPGCDLYRLLVEAFHRHLDLGEHGAYVVLALYPVLSFVYLAFPAVPFLLFLGPKATGKSQALDTLSKLCRCGHKSRPSPTALGDLIAGQRAIPLIDQANDLQGELLQNAIDSYRKGASRTVTNIDNRGMPHRFEIFGPKVFAAHAFDDDLRDRCIQIAMLPAVRTVEPLLADDKRLDELRHHLYRFTTQNFWRLSETTAYTKRDELGERLSLSGRELELWWPYEVLFEWLDVPEEDREAGRSFYRASIPSTKAELDDCANDVLRALQTLSREERSLEVSSDELLKAIKATGGTGYGASRIGSRLRDLGLVLDKRRIRSGGQRVMVWTINVDRLQHQLAAWGLLDAMTEP